MKKHLLTNSYDRRGGITQLKRNAFTLIELLAIIVILAIIAVITVPIILNIIENSRKGAATDSAYGYKDSVNKFYITELQNHNKLKLDGTYTVNSDGSLEPTEDNTFGFGDSEYGNSLNVAVSGTIPSSGKLRYSNNVLNAGCVVIGDYKVTFGTDGKVDGTTKGDCNEYVFPTVAQTWNKYYAFYGSSYEDTAWDEEEIITTEFNDNWKVWIQENTTSGDKEICNTFSSGEVVCVKPSTDLTYISNKVGEIEAKGATCSLDNGHYYCIDNNVATIFIQIYIDDSQYLSGADTVLYHWQSDCHISDDEVNCGH